VVPGLPQNRRSRNISGIAGASSGVHDRRDNGTNGGATRDDQQQLNKHVPEPPIPLKARLHAHKTI
jgi:hypothetical protein